VHREILAKKGFDRPDEEWHTVIDLSQAEPAVEWACYRSVEETEGEPYMSLANHLEELQRKHGDIERELDQAKLHPSVDTLQIATLKRRKLALKDEIAKLAAQQTRH
jgi:hypothetical protein